MSSSLSSARKRGISAPHSAIVSAGNHARSTEEVERSGGRCAAPARARRTSARCHAADASSASSPPSPPPPPPPPTREEGRERRSLPRLAARGAPRSITAAPVPPLPPFTPASSAVRAPHSAPCARWAAPARSCEEPHARRACVAQLGARPLGRLPTIDRVVDWPAARGRGDAAALLAGKERQPNRQYTLYSARHSHPGGGGAVELLGARIVLPLGAARALLLRTRACVRARACGGQRATRVRA
jgi:hypothetical protein